MSSEDGLIRAFGDLGDIETAARDVYEELLEKLTDRELRDFTTWLVRAEERHMVLVEEALDLVRGD